jgi:hypothetical protein
MSIPASAFEYRRCGVESATRPIEPSWRTLAALLLLAGRCLLWCAPRRAAPSKHSPLGGQRSTRSDKRGGYVSALPAHTMTAHSGAFNRGR